MLSQQFQARKSILRHLFHLGMLLVLAFSCIGARAQTNFPAPVTDNIVRVGLLTHPVLTESSGLAASQRYAEVFWTHNDGGEQFIFGINRSGEYLGAYEVQGANLIDWEAITLDDFGNLYLADTGTNGMFRTHCAVHRVEEPDPSREWGAARVEKTWLLGFPGEREDCEGFFVQDGYGYLVSKYPRAGAVSLYRFPLGDSSEYTLELVARIPMDSPVSDAALSPDRQRLALVTEDAVEVFFINGDPANSATAPRRDTEYDNDSMEGITFVPEGLLVTSEGIRDVLLFISPQLTGAPDITRPLSDQAVFVGEDVIFSVAASGIPDVSYTWFFNRLRLIGQTNSTLLLTNVTLADAGIYHVAVSNAAGTAHNSARLTVLEPSADLRITEVMSSPASGFPKEDWWELTNLGTNAINLTGWRFNDNTGDLSDAFTIPAGVVIQPGESIIFVENLSPSEFRSWWGGTNRISAETQIITYSGLELSFSADGDTLRLWASGVTNVNTVYEQVTFGAAATGVSFGFNPDTGVFGEPSRPQEFGAFFSLDGLDLGSPGRIRTPPPPVQSANVRITEVMSNPAGTVTKEDWWELTSFDTNIVDLSGWRFNDNTGGTNDAFVIPAGITIAPGESVVFVENLSPAEFLAWWGTNVAPGTQIITYSGLGLSFSSLGDILRLWTTNTASVFTEVSFGAALPGVSFGYDPESGTFGQPSQAEEDGAFLSTDGLDVGSPGRIRGETTPVETIDVRITEVMSSQAPGSPPEDWWELTSFDTVAVDLSGWRFNDNTGGLEDAYTIPPGVSIEPGESIIFIENLTPEAFLAWWGTDRVDPGTKIFTYTGIQLSFSSAGDALRIWTNGVTDSSATFASVTFGAAPAGVSFGYNPDTETFGALSQPNIHGAFRAAAGADIGSPGRIRGEVDILDVRVTEVMSSQALEAPQEDWWELTSFEAEPIDLSGWRFNDNSGDASDAFIIPAGTTIQPGESIIFVENLTPQEFRSWWGGANLPATLQIITYTGAELSFASAGDAVRLWTTNTDSVFVQVDFGIADAGISFGYNPDAGTFGEKSTNQLHGAFTSTTGDVGSPGRIRGTAGLGLRYTADSVAIEITQPGNASYTLDFTDDLSSGEWVPTNEILQSTNGAPILIEKSLDRPMRFYRVRML